MDVESSGSSSSCSSSGSSRIIELRIRVATYDGAIAETEPT